MASPHQPLTQLFFYLTERSNLACRRCWLAPEFDTDRTEIERVIS